MGVRALVLLSGGQDSTTCLAAAIAAHGVENVEALSIDYGQRHGKEVTAAQAIARLLGVEWDVVDLEDVLLSTSPLLSDASLDDVRGIVAEPGAPRRVEQTFVPMRNALFLVVAANWSVAGRCKRIYVGVSEEDYGGYPDCRREFLESFMAMVGFALGEAGPPPILECPLLHLDKAGTVKLMRSLEVAVPRAWEALGLSWSCYEGGERPCGKCHACVLRARGFERAGEFDPALEGIDGG